MIGPAHDSDDASLPILVAACGNAWAGDDAFGPEVARQLRLRRPTGLEIVDLGMKPAGLLDHLGPDRRGVIIVDAAQADGGCRPGELIDVDFMSPHRPALLHDVALSSHGLSIAHELALARTLDLSPPRIHLIAVGAQVTAMGSPMSDNVREAVELAVRRTLQLVETWRRGDA